MKIIELLNKIANGKIEYEQKIKIDNDIITVSDLLGAYIFNKKRLNDEVEILEEEKKIPEKIPEEIIVGKKQPTHRIKKIEKKINEIISYLDYLKSKGDE